MAVVWGWELCVCVYEKERGTGDEKEKRVERPQGGGAAMLRDKEIASFQTPMKHRSMLHLLN